MRVNDKIMNIFTVYFTFRQLLYNSFIIGDWLSTVTMLRLGCKVSMFFNLESLLGEWLYRVENHCS